MAERQTLLLEEIRLSLQAQRQDYTAQIAGLQIEFQG